MRNLKMRKQGGPFGFALLFNAPLGSNLEDEPGRSLHSTRNVADVFAVCFPIRSSAAIESIYSSFLRFGCRLILITHGAYFIG